MGNTLIQTNPKNKLSSIEQVLLRFPKITDKILSELDNQSLTKFKETSREVCNYMVQSRQLWIRIIQKCVGHNIEVSEQWKIVVNKTPIKIINIKIIE